MLLFHSKYCTFFLQQAENHEIDGFERRQSTPTPGAMSETMCVVFLFPKKKNIFLWKIFFRILHYSTAMPESSPIMKIINFMKNHDFHWFSMVFIDFCQKSWKLMGLSGPKVLPHPALCQKRCVLCFCFSRKQCVIKKATKTISELIPDATGVQDHRKSYIFMIFDQNQWKSMKITVFHQNWWFSWPVSALSIAVK